MEIYLDNCATTKVCEEAIRASVYAMSEQYANPSSLHKKGFEAEKLITDAKRVFANALSCDEREIYFTSCATESNNMSIIGTAFAKKRVGNKIITTQIEHPSVLQAVKYLETQGFEVVTIKPGKDGSFNAEDFYDATDDKTILVSTMLVNNEVGLILPVDEIGKAVKRKTPDVIYHVDAVQAFGKLPIKLKNSPIDLLSASGHKTYAPKGIGLIYIKKGVRLTPLLYGGGQQKGIRPGTESVPLICAFAAAVESIDIKENLEHYNMLKNYLISRLSEIEEVSVNSNENCVPYIVNISVKGVRSEVNLHFLEQYGIFVSSGSACAKGEKSYVLKALGCNDKQIDTALRISFSKDTQKSDIDELVDRLKLGIKTLIKLK